MQARAAAHNLTYPPSHPACRYYTNLCFKAVNQSIGRAIRHKGDYATIVLADQRFGKASVHERLPRWISQQLIQPGSFEQTLGAVRGFFDRWAPDQAQRVAARRANLEQPPS